MSFHVFWPAACALTMFMLLIIMVILKYGSRLCKARHATFADDEAWEGKAYEQKVSYA